MTTTKEPTLQREVLTSAFEALVVEHHRTVLAYARSLVYDSSDAEDLAQEAFVTAWQQFDRFEADRDFGKWVRGILRNKVRNHLRRRKMQPLEPGHLEAMEAAFSMLQQAQAREGDRLMDLLDRCIRRLGDTLRRSIELFYREEKSCAEIATAMEAREPTVRKRLQLAREQLGDCVQRTSGGMSDPAPARGKSS